MKSIILSLSLFCIYYSVAIEHVEIMKKHLFTKFQLNVKIVNRARIVALFSKFRKGNDLIYVQS